MRKIIAAVVVVLIGLGFLLFSNLSGTVKTIIETAGSTALGTPVHVSGLDISLANQTASLSGFVVTNPPGFKTDNLLKTKSISITLGGVANKTITIKEIVVDGMTVTYELGPNGTNLQALQRNIKSPTASPANKSEDKGSGFGVIIQQLKIVNAQVIPAISGFSGTVKMPDIILNNIGSKNNPATPAQVAAQIMNRVLASSSVAALKSGLTALPNGAAVGKATDTLKGLFSK